MTETNLPKRVLLVGGTSLIGQSIADKNGVEIVTPTRKELDLLDANSIQKYKFENFDCLIIVAGAGMRHGRTFTFAEDDVDVDYITNTIGVNCTGNTLLLKEYLRRNKKGHVVIIGSVVVNDLKNTNVVYTSSKMYLDRLIDLLENLYPDITFIKINPGLVKSRNQKDIEKSIEPTDVADLVWKAIEKNIKRIDITK